jgi:mono/diheme cytochrome c family protein
LTDRQFRLSDRAVRFVSITLALAVFAVAGCARKPLPETGSADEQLYAQRCGSCHRAYQPSTLTSAMWQMQVEAMQIKMQNAGIAPLTAHEQGVILGYLERNAPRTQ